jgi:hypothetical protein
LPDPPPPEVDILQPAKTGIAALAARAPIV